MLFDLRSGKRRRVVQVVFGGLAVLFAVGFVFFGIGSEQQGGLADLLGTGDGDDGASSVYDSQIEDAEDKLAKDPKHPGALTDLARYRFLAGQEELDFDEETGVATLTEEARDEWNLALDAWERYVKTDPRSVDPQVANQMICAYVPQLPQCGTQASAEANNFGGATQTQQLLAEEEPTTANYFALAAYLYYEGEVREGDAAADRAVAEAKESEREKLEKDLAGLKKDTQRYLEAQRVAAQAGAPGEEPSLQDPFGGLGGGTGSALPPASSP